MIIAGAKGFAVQITDILLQIDPEMDLSYYDDMNDFGGQRFLNHYPIIQDFKELVKYISEKDNRFVLGLSQPANRKLLFEKFTKIGGIVQRVISPYAVIGSKMTKLGEGINILTGCIIESTVEIGTGCLINSGSIITHGCRLGTFCEIGPRTTFCGDCTIGNEVFIGAGTTILRNIHIGNNVLIGAQSLVTKDIPPFSKVKGSPAR